MARSSAGKLKFGASPDELILQIGHIFGPAAYDSQVFFVVTDIEYDEDAKESTVSYRVASRADFKAVVQPVHSTHFREMITVELPDA